MGTREGRRTWRADVHASTILRNSALHQFNQKANIHSTSKALLFSHAKDRQQQQQQQRQQQHSPPSFELDYSATVATHSPRLPSLPPSLAPFFSSFHRRLPLPGRASLYHWPATDRPPVHKARSSPRHHLLFPGDIAGVCKVGLEGGRGEGAE